MAGEPQGNGDFEQLTRRFRPVLMAFFLRRLENHAEAEDMTQEVFARLAAHKGDAVASYEGYIFQMAANMLRDRGRREKVRRQYREGFAQIEGLDVDPLDPLRIATDREALSLLRGAIAELPDRTRTIFLLCRLENADRHVLAESFDVSVSTIDREIARALALLTRKVRGTPTS